MGRRDKRRRKKKQMEKQSAAAMQAKEERPAEKTPTPTATEDFQKRYKLLKSLQSLR